MLQYYYTRDDTYTTLDLQVIKSSDNMYTVILNQGAFDPDDFNDIITPPTYVLISKEIEDQNFDRWWKKRLITLKINAPHNPRPEYIFTLITKEKEKTYQELSTENQDLTKKVQELLIENKEFFNEIEKLKTHIMYQPDGPGYFEAKADFQKQLENIDLK